MIQMLGIWELRIGHLLVTCLPVGKVGNWLLVILLLLAPLSTNAQELTFQYQDQIFQIMPQLHWQKEESSYFFRTKEVTVKDVGNPPKGVTKRRKRTWDSASILQTIESKIASVLNRPAGKVTIKRNEEGDIVFEGLGLPGRELDTALATELTQKALEEGIYTIQLPVTEEAPEVFVEDDELKEKGIYELISIGESDFSRSPANRIHNIGVGISSFNGHLVEPEKEFSFNEILGPVNAYNNYRKELTILGDRTIPAFGGGLCQVSTTAYRGIWKAGFPITSRRNHSYAVRYYAPAGTDATIFPPWTDLRFLNDTENSILIQTHTEGSNAYFLYYGTKPEGREVELVGPMNWDIKNPPENRIVYTEEIPPGEKRVVGRAVPGMKTMWYRYLTYADDKEVIEPFFSEYEARPYYEEIGTLAFDDGGLDGPRIILPEEDLSKDPSFDVDIPRRGERVRVRR